jgi:2,3-bisphosphoglycerate-independent phosphoglycerate mutase
MRRTIIIAPGLAGSSDSDSVLLQDLPSLQTLQRLGRFCKIAGLPNVATPEALYLGLDPTEAQMAQGPLIVSALGADPPDRSTHFHLSLLSLDDGLASLPPGVPSAEEQTQLWEAMERLNTKTLTLLKGEGLDHGLVWEGIGDFLTVAPHLIDGQRIAAHLPQGDAEVLLRRLLDDSVNLLGELDANRRRAEEGIPPLNLLWPWGAGRRTSVPNLILRRGEQAVVESSSMRMEGLVRLSGYKHADRGSFGSGLRTRFEQIAERCLSRDISLVILEGPAALRAQGLMEELEWFAHEMDARLLKPLLASALTNQEQLGLFSPGPQLGLATLLDGRPRDTVYPFDERSLEDKGVPTRDVWALVDHALQSPSPLP